MRPWYRWVSYVSPFAYTEEALLINQLAGDHLPCSPGSLIPAIQNASVAHQTCAVLGAQPGSNSFSTSAYLQKQYGFSDSHQWRNYGIVCSYFFVITSVAMIGAALKSFPTGDAGGTKKFVKRRVLERAPDFMQLSRAKKSSEVPKGITFTWDNLSYSVGDRELLQESVGILRPGKVMALMGPSGVQNPQYTPPMLIIYRCWEDDVAPRAGT